MATRQQPQKKNSALARALSDAKSGTHIPANVLVAKAPQLAALLSKMRKPSNHIEKEIEKNPGNFFYNRGQLDKLSQAIRTSVHDNDNILNMFPDMWLAEQILVSSILSPKDMTQNSLSFTTAETLFSSSVQTELTKIINTLFEKHYDFKEQLPLIISNALFRKGAHIKLVLPENILDDIINGSANSSFAMESLSPLFTRVNNSNEIRSLGFIGSSRPNPVKNKTKMAIESWNTPTSTHDGNLFHNGGALFSDLVEVTDNFNLLKLPAIENVRIHNIAQEAVTTVGEYKNPSAKISAIEFKNTVFKSKNPTTKIVVAAPDPSMATRKSVSRPLIMDAPTECCIPVTRPGKPEEKVGGFFLVDVDGNFVTKNTTYSHMEGLSSLISSSDSSGSITSAMLEKTAKSLVPDDKGSMTIDHITKLYSNVVQRNLVEKLRNGRYQATMDVALTQQVSEIMLARVLCDQFTRVLYIPASLFTYFAFDCDDNGVGKSYLDEVKMLTSIRGILLFAKVMGLVKNSINVSRVKVKLDPRDPDPDTHMEKSVDRIMRVRQQYFPFGINSMPELADWVTKAGLEIGFEGHPDIPDVGFEFENSKSDHNIPDNDLDELLRDYTYMRFGITSEMVDGAKEVDFASTIQSQNMLFAKRIRVLQHALCNLITDYVQKVMRYDPIVKNEIIEIFSENAAGIKEKLSTEGIEMLEKSPEQFGDYMFELAISNIRAFLPPPDEIKSKLDKDLISEKEEAYKIMIEYFLNSEFAPPEIIGQWSTNIDMLKSAYLAYLMRNWAAENNILPEVFDIVSLNDEGKPNVNLSDEYSKIFETLSVSFINFVKYFKPLKFVTDTDLKKQEQVEASIASDIQANDAESSMDDESIDGIADMQASAQPPADDASTAEST